MSSLYNQLFSRNYGVIDSDEQKKLLNAKVTVVGAGGVGSITLISLVRMGVGNVHIVDMDRFEPSNLNRQMLSSVSRLELLKAECAKQSLLDINPELNVSVSYDRLDEDNAQHHFQGVDVIIDATDNLVSRVIIHRAAQKAAIPSIWIAVTPPFRGGVMTFSDQTPAYEQVLRHPSYNKPLTTEVRQQINAIKNERAKKSVEFGASSEWANAFVAGESPWAVLCPVANMVGLLASFEAFKLIVKRNNLLPTYAPQLIKIDLAKTDMVKVETPVDGSWDNAYL